MPRRRFSRTLGFTKTSIRNAIARFSYIPQIVQLIWSAARYWTLAWAILLLLQGLLPAATVYLTRVLVDGLVTVVGAGLAWSAVQPILLPAGLIVAAMLLTEVLGSLIELVRIAQSELVEAHVSRIIHQKAVAIDYEHYESSDYYDRLYQASHNSGNRSLALLENVGAVLQDGVTLIAVALIILPYGIWLPVLLFLSTLPAFLILLRLNWRNHQWWVQASTDYRRMQYYESLQIGHAAAAEVRLFNLAPRFESTYQSLRQKLRQEQVALAKERSFGRLQAGLVALAAAVVALLWMARQVLLGAMTLGDLALFYQAFSRGQGLIRSLLGNLGQVYHNSLFLSRLFEFLQLESQIGDPPQPQPLPVPLQQGIRLHNLTFRYPGCDRPVFENFNLVLPAGKVVAIVGDNGAGKSTLFKLLCRLYQPEAGRIELDGIDICDLSLAELRQRITVLFQAPVPYFTSAADNIAFGNINANPSLREIQLAASDAGIHETIARLPQGYETLLGKWFPDGTELSGGEWQRLALARAFLRRAPIMILDEPTSAMDPWSENDWLERFYRLAQGRTAIVITHRLVVARRADLIYLMRHGKLVESGTHRELIDRGGLYAQSWASQMGAPAATDGLPQNGQPQPLI